MDIHDRAQKTDVQPASSVSADQIVINEKVVRVNGDDYWLYGAVDPETN